MSTCVVVADGIVFRVPMQDARAQPHLRGDVGPNEARELTRWLLAAPRRQRPDLLGQLALA